MTAIGTRSNAGAFHKTGHIVHGFLSKDEMAKVIKVGEGAKPKRGTVDQGNAEKTEDRSCSLSWIRYKQVPDLWEKLCEASYTHGVNQFKLDMLADPPKEYMQYTIYEKGEYYHWHFDLYGTRKLTGLILLNKDFKGGEHQQCLSNTPTTINLDPGDLFLFPSYIVHRCAPVTKGRRLALATFFHGPRLQ